MLTYLVTGCAGFISTTFVHYMLKRYTDIRIVNLDALTYAGNLENLKGLEDDERHVFVHGNICDAGLVANLIKNTIQTTSSTLQRNLMWIVLSQIRRSLLPPMSWAQSTCSRGRKKPGMMQGRRHGKKERSTSR